MEKEIEKMIKTCERNIEEAQLNFKSCKAQGMSDGALHNIYAGIQRETGKLNAYKDCYLLANSYDYKLK